MKFKKLICLFLSGIMLLSGCTVTTNNDPSRPFGSYTNYSTTYSSSWSLDSNVGVLNESVASGARKKKTKIKGNNKDVVTIMVYMCGSNLESESGMASSDLKEMAKATIGSNVNLIVFTGGSTKWYINGISSKYNQIYKVENGGITCLDDNAGSGAMVDPATLTSFIEYGVKNYKANRYELILWDHGGGSVSGFGSDENYSNKGSMSLAGIDEALEDAGVNFDFIGFDACLMANTETAIMLSEHADYLIASEESEPGIGWYYTDWLTTLSNNTSISTLELGKTICDSFVSTCKKSASGQSATLSVIDLAEVHSLIPDLLTDFSSDLSESISSDYSTVSKNRANTKELAADCYVDLVDLVDFANNIDNDHSDALISGLLSCIKYNNVSSDMVNSYGLSIYFPYRSNSYVNTVLSVYEDIDMNEEYSECVKSFAQYKSAGTVSSGGSHSAYNSFSSYDSSTYSSQDTSSSLYDLFDYFLSGNYSSSTSNSTNSGYSYYANYGYGSLFGKSLNDETKKILDYIVDNHFNTPLEWEEGKIFIAEDQWKLISSIKLNVFVDDGEGYIDLGKDNVFDIDDDGNLLIEDDLTWIAISNDGENYQVVPYYYLYSVQQEDEVIATGYIPILYNGNKAKMLIKIDDEGFTMLNITLEEDETLPVGKSFDELNEGDEIKFICDYYDYDGNYSSSYVLGDSLIIEDDLYFGDVDISEYDVLALYELCDIYQQSYYTTPM